MLLKYMEEASNHEKDFVVQLAGDAGGLNINCEMLEPTKGLEFDSVHFMQPMLLERALDGK